MSATITSSGRVVKDAELRTAGNTQVLNARVAVDNGYGDKKKTDFFNIAIWGKRGESLAPYLTKGTFVVFTGEFSTKPYEHNGENRVDLQVNVDRLELGPRSAAAGDDRRAARDESQSVNGSQAAGGAAVTDLEDEIPF